jgi:transposase
LEVVDGHSQEKVTEVLMRQPENLREQVEEVSVDMWVVSRKLLKSFQMLGLF